MGCKFTGNQFPTNNDITEKSICLNDFKKLKIIGRGGFGRVWKVEKKNGKKIFAMKIMSKVKVVDKNSVGNINTELFLLSRIDHPFLIPVYFAFQDKEFLYMVMDYFSGGDLRYHLLKRIKFNEEQTKFIISCLLLALEYLHYNSIIHRDLKPENLIFDEQGYVHLTDLGVAKQLENNKEYVDSSGTPGYMAPEVINHMHHNITADFFSVGVMMFELMIGKRPYKGKTRKDIKTEMLLGEVKITSEMVPLGWSLESADFTNKLLRRRVAERLGYRGIKELKKHPWLSDVDWEKLYRREIVSPYIPQKGDNYDHVSANKKEVEIDKYQEILDQVNKNKEFFGYYFDINDPRIKDKKLYFPNPHIGDNKISFKKHTQPNCLSLQKKSYLNSSYDVFCKNDQDPDMSELWINRNVDDSQNHNLFKSGLCRERDVDAHNLSGELSNYNNYSYIHIKPVEKNLKSPLKIISQLD